jgi:hypothetical protein
MEYRDELKLVIKAEVDKAVRDLNQYNKTTKQAQTSTEAFARAAQFAKRALATAGLGMSVAYISSQLNKFAKSASEAEETASKFSVVFGDIATTAEEVARRYASSFNVAASTSKELLGNVGDLLTGMGATQAQALELSEAVATFGSDLASFSNYAGGAAGAVQALTKMMLGEREMVKSLGIVIREADVQQRLLEKGQEDLTGQAKLLATAQASLELAMEQSKNAIGDYERTADSSANVTRRLSESYKEMTEHAGGFVNRVLTPLKSGLADVIDHMNELARENQGLGEIPAEDPRIAQMERNNRRIAELKQEANENIAVLKTGYRELQEIAQKPVEETENWWEGYTLETKLDEARRLLEDFYEDFTGNPIKISLDSEQDLQAQLQALETWMNKALGNTAVGERIDALIKDNERLQAALDGTAESTEEAAVSLGENWEKTKKAIFGDESLSSFADNPITLPPIYSETERLQAELGELEKAIHAVWEGHGDYASLDAWQDDLGLLVAKYEEVKGDIEDITQAKETEKRIEELKTSLLSETQQREQERLALQKELNAYQEKGLLTLEEVQALLASFDGQDIFSAITENLDEQLSGVDRAAEAYSTLTREGEKLSDIYNVSAEKSLLVTRAFDQLASSTEVSREELAQFLELYGEWIGKSEEAVTGFEALQQEFSEFDWSKFSENLETELSEHLIDSLNTVFGEIGKGIGSGELQGKEISSSIISSATSMFATAAGPFAPLVHLAGGIFEGISSSIFETIEQAKQVDKALSDANESIQDMFLDVLDLEEELAKQRIEAIEDEMDLLEQNRDLRLEILRDQWQRGQITGTQYFDQASRINKNYNEDQRSLENQDTLISGIGDVITELTGELEGLSGWTKFWTGKDEDLEERIATYKQLLGDISSDPDGLTDNEISELASRYNIDIPAAATGADFITNGPQLLLVGDNAGGKERVQVSPITSPNLHGPSGGDINITITGDVYGVDDLYARLDAAGKRLKKLGRVSA